MVVASINVVNDFGAPKEEKCEVCVKNIFCVYVDGSEWRSIRPESRHNCRYEVGSKHSLAALVSSGIGAIPVRRHFALNM